MRVLRECRTALFALAKKTTIRPGPERKGYQRDALFAANAFVPSEQLEPRALSFLWASRKKSSLPNRRARQNQLIRTNHSRRARLVSTPVRNLSATLRPPFLCALCVKFPFHASLFIASFAPETRLVAQGAAPVAGPEAFSRRIFPRYSGERHEHLSPALSALAQNASATHAESALPFSKDLNMTGINTYKNDHPIRMARPERRAGARELSPMRFSRQTSSSRVTNRSEGTLLNIGLTSLGWPCRTARAVAQVAPAVISGQRDLRLLSAKAHTCSMCNSRRMKSC